MHARPQNIALMHVPQHRQRRVAARSTADTVFWRVLAEGGVSRFWRLWTTLMVTSPINDAQTNCQYNNKHDVSYIWKHSFLISKAITRGNTKPRSCENKLFHRLQLAAETLWGRGDSVKCTNPLPFFFFKLWTCKLSRHLKIRAKQLTQTTV